MTFPRTDTRRLVVAGVAFRWHVGSRADADYGVALGTLQAEGANGSAGILHYWAGFPSPAHAADVVREALAQGWQPMETPAPVWFDVREGRRTLSAERCPAPWDEAKPAR